MVYRRPFAIFRHGPKVLVRHNEWGLELANDAVVICAGGVLPTPFLKKIGIQVETKYGTA